MPFTRIVIPGFTARIDEQRGNNVNLMTPILVIATRNRGKTVEIRNLLDAYPLRIRNLEDFDPIPEVEEDGATFTENALKKAAHAARMLELPALADDSGLVVDALNGRPGVHTARYGGEGISDMRRYEKLLGEMKGVSDRKARFECVISIAAPSGDALVYEGRCEGLLAEAPSGTGGFGYDPVFFCPETGKTFAEMSLEEKSRFSHRGRALAQVQSEFDAILAWIRNHMPEP